MKTEIGNLSAAIAGELAQYSEEIADAVKAAATETMEELVKATKADAPKRTGAFRKAIKSVVTKEGKWDKRMTWYVKVPQHRLTHLIEDGHRTRSGTKTRAHPFFRENYARAEEAFERRVKEAIQNAK